MNAPGKGLLKVVSILFIIFGAIATVISIVGLIGSAALAEYLGDFAVLLIVGMILVLVVSALELILGIVGLRKCANPAQGGFFIATGIILCVLSLVSLILNFSVTGLIGFVLPILYIVGGSMNKKASSLAA